MGERIQFTAETQSLRGKQKRAGSARTAALLHWQAINKESDDPLSHSFYFLPALATLTVPSRASAPESFREPLASLLADDTTPRPMDTGAT